jgi:hypothetical protein
MSITASEMTPADIRACCGNDNNGGFGGMWGDWIILFLLFGMFGYGGFGGGFGFGGFGGGGLNGVLTRADINEGFALNNITGGIQAIQQGICDSTYALTNAVNSGFHGVERGMWDVSRQIGDCCCQTQRAIDETHRAIDGVNYNMAKGFCDLGNVIQNTTRDVIDNANANSRAILDFLTQDKIATLTAENQSLKFAASQNAQNALINASLDAQSAELIRRLGRDCPIPAYVVPNPNCCTNSCGF